MASFVYFDKVKFGKYSSYKGVIFDSITHMTPILDYYDMVIYRPCLTIFKKSPKILKFSWTTFIKLRFSYPHPEFIIFPNSIHSIKVVEANQNPVLYRIKIYSFWSFIPFWTKSRTITLAKANFW